MTAVGCMVPEIWNATDTKWKTLGDIIILHRCTISDNHMMYGSWDAEQNGHNFLSFWTIFYPFIHLTTQKIKILKRWEKTWRYIPQVTIIWCMVSDIWSAIERSFSHFGPFFALLHPPIPPPSNNPKNQDFEKLKKPPGDIIILLKNTINDNHMMYGSWTMEHDRQNFLLFWTVFCPFTPLTTRKIKILKKWKNSLEILSFYTHVP